MWGKKEQIVFWGTAYLPLLLIMIYRFVDSKDYFKKTNIAIWLAKHIDKVLFDTIIFGFIIVISLLLYRKVSKWYFDELEVELYKGDRGRTFYIRKYKKISANEYTFFLMTLLLPLFSLDHSSIINFLVTVLIIVVVISIYVNTNFIIVCPLFFISGRYVYEGIISEYSKEEEEKNSSLRKSVYIITNEKYLDLNNQFRCVKLIDNIYYVVKNNN